MITGFDKIDDNHLDTNQAKNAGEKELVKIQEYFECRLCMRIPD